VGFGDGGDGATGLGPKLLRGVLYAGVGNDEIEDADSIFGGSGNDSLDGNRVYGGLGDDQFSPSEEYEPIRNVLCGGPDDDSLNGPGWLYGGLGDDSLGDSGSNQAGVPDMLVGGPGSDVVELIGGAGTVVRLRGGGADSLYCDGGAP
jgi:hypothetical protein